MGGNPLRRLVLTVGGLLLLLPALWHLTRATPANATPASTVAAPAASSVHVEVTFAHAPLEFSLTSLGKVLWSENRVTGTVARELPMAFPAEGVDLEIKATWPAGTETTAVRVNVTPPQQDTISQTAWATSSMDEVLTFKESTP